MYDAPGHRPGRAPGRRAEAVLRLRPPGRHGPHTIVNPTIVESRGEWVYEEGCLSVPRPVVEIVRPKEVLLTGFDLDGNEVSIEADELLARVFQHELDHLDGVLMFERLTRRAAQGRR